MNKIKKIKECVFSMETLSRRIITYAVWCVILLYIAGSVYMICGSSGGDLSTVLYWAGQVGLLGKELLGATVVPVLIFEILFWGKGLKNSSRM